MKITLDPIILQVIFQTITWSQLWGQKSMLCAKQASLYFHDILHWIFKIFQREVTTLWTATEWTGKLQHWSQTVTLSPALPAAKKGWDWPHPVLRGTFLAAARSREMLVLLFRKEHLSFATLLSIRTTFRAARKASWSQLLWLPLWPPLVVIKLWLGFFVVPGETSDLQGAEAALYPQRAKMLQRGKALPIREASGVETMTKSLGKVNPSTGKH